jgi:conjugal transfer mating pair stabilization protein TraG
VQRENMTKKTTSLSLIASTLLLWASPAMALDMEYYTYGGFDLMVQAFNLVALIFSDIDYRGLLPTFAILGLLLGAAGWIAGEASGARQMPLGWALKVLTGIIIYTAFFIPTGRVAIYDATLNKTQTIGGVPDGIILVAGVLNKIERIIVKICDTAAGPAAAYSGNAGGIGFELLGSLNNTQEIYAQMSMGEYIERCVKFEIMRPGTKIGYENFLGETTDFLPILAEAVNPAIFTMYFDGTNPAGTTMSCTAAWNKLRSIYSTPRAFDAALAKTCSNAALNPSDPNQLLSCKALIENTANYATGTSGLTTDVILRQSQLSSLLYHTFGGDAYSGAALQANRSVTTRGFGVGIAMSEWVPIIKSLLNALAICLIPFLALLLPTPIVGKVLSAMVGFFLYLTIWGGCDAVIHMAAMSYAGNTFQKIGPNNLGMIAMANIPTLGAKTLGMFGYVRSSGMLLAAVFTQLLVQFGGSALAHLAGGLTGAVAQGGAEAGKMLTPEGRTTEQMALIKAAANMSVEAQDKFTGRASAMAFEESKKVAELENARIAADQAGLPTGMKSLALSKTGMQQFTASTTASVQSVSAQGFNRKDDIGRSGLGTGLSTGAGGELKGHVDNGQWSLVGANVTGVDQAKLGQVYIRNHATGIANSFVHTDGWSKALGEATTAGNTDATNRGFTDQIGSDTRAAVTRDMKEGSGWAKEASQDDIVKVNAALGGGAILVKGETGITAQYINGTKRNLTLSESTAQSLGNTVTQAQSESFGNILSSTQGRQWASNLTRQMGDTATSSSINELRNMDQNRMSYGGNIQGVIVDQWAQEHYGVSNRDTQERAANDISSLVQNGGAEGLGQYNQFVDRVLQEKGYDALHSQGGSISTASNAAGPAGSGVLKSVVEAAAGRVEQHTAGVVHGDPQHGAQPNHVSLGTEPRLAGAPNLEKNLGNLNQDAAELHAQNDQVVNHGPGMPQKLKEGGTKVAEQVGEVAEDMGKVISNSILDKPVSGKRESPDSSYEKQGIYKD